MKTTPRTTKTASKSPLTWVKTADGKWTQVRSDARPGMVAAPVVRSVATTRAVANTAALSAAILAAYADPTMRGVIDRMFA